MWYGFLLPSPLGVGERKEKKRKERREKKGEEKKKNGSLG
jgi:hypothetical protein